MGDEDKGWICLYRSVRDHWLWDDRPFSKGQAWMDLLLMVNHKPSKTFMDGKYITVRRGSCITSIRSLAEKWGWSRKRVTLFLDRLEADSMLVKKSDTKKTVLTVVNYGKYQDQGATKKPAKRRKGDARETQAHTNNNEQLTINNKREKTVGSADIPPSAFLNKPVGELSPEELEAKRQYLRR